MSLLNFRNPVQQALFECELMGQISDGMWENAKPYDHWKKWGECDVDCSPNKPLGRTGFWPRKDNYNFASPELLDVIGERMVWLANLAEAQQFSIDDLRSFYDFTDRDSTEKYWVEKRAQCIKIFGSYKTLDAIRRNGSYDMKKLKAELTDMKSIIRMQN